MAIEGAPWNEHFSAEATIQHTDARVFVGGPLDFVAEAAARQGAAVPTSASSTLDGAFDGLTPRQVMTLVSATAFLNKGVVFVGGEALYSYSSKDGNELQIEDQLTGGQARGWPEGTEVAQWFNISRFVSEYTLRGSRQGNQAVWTGELIGNNWNAALIPPNCSILIQEQQWDNTKGPLPMLAADMTSWRDEALMYADEPVASVRPDGIMEWSVTTQGRNKYLRAQKVLAGRYGAKVLTGTHTQSSTLQNVLTEPDEGKWGGNDFSAPRAGDNNRQTVAITLDIPTHNTRPKNPVGGNFFRMAEGVKAYGYKIQQLHINGRPTGRYSRQALNWIEFWNPYDPTDCEVPPCNVGNANYWILENDKGHRVYLGAQHGWVTPKITMQGHNSLIACYNEQAFRSGWKVPQNATVWPWQECDGYIPEWDDGNFSKSGKLMHGAGQVFNLDPKGGWLMVRRRPAMRDSAFIMVDWKDPEHPNGGYFAENVVDFIAWGDANLMGPHPTLGSGIPSSIPELRIINGQSGEVLDEILFNETDFWGAYDQVAGEFSPTPKISVVVPIRPDGIASIPVGAALIRKNCQAGGVAWGRTAENEPILDPDESPPTMRFDSNSPDDFEVVSNPTSGTIDSIDVPAWHKIELGTFTPPVVVEDDFENEKLVLDDATNFPIPEPGKPQYVVADQQSVTANGPGSSITFSYEYRDETTLYGVKNRTPGVNTPSDGDNVLEEDTELTLMIDLANPDTSLDQLQPMNLHQLTGLWLRRFSRTTSAPSAIKDFTIRISRLAEPNDPLTYLGRDNWEGNPDWETVATFHDNTQTDLFIPVELKFARWIILVCHGMSDEGRLKINEFVPLGVPNEMKLDDWGDWHGSPTYNSASVISTLLRRAGIPERNIRVGGGFPIRSVDVGDGDPMEASAELCEQNGTFLYEDLLNTFWTKHDHSMPGWTAPTPRLILTPAVVRGKVQYQVRPLFQAGQIELQGRDDRDQMEWTVQYPAERDVLLGAKRTVSRRFVTSAEHALLLAEYEYRLANGGTQLSLNIGSYGEIDVGDIVRVENILVDVTGQEVLARDYIVDEIEKTYKGGVGKLVNITIRERVIW